MKLNEGFKNVFSYAAGMEKWVKNNLDTEMEYTFAKDFAIADWVSGINGVKETYERVKKEWLGNYKAFTEVALSLNLLAWAHNQLEEQGFEGRNPFIKLYSELWHQAKYDYYEKYANDKEKQDYFFYMTD